MVRHLFGVQDAGPRQRGVGLYLPAWQLDRIEDLVEFRQRLVAAGARGGESSHGATPRSPQPSTDLTSATTTLARRATMRGAQPGLTSGSGGWPFSERVITRTAVVCGPWRRPGLVVHASSEGAAFMIILGVVLLIIGFIANISILWTVGIILVVVGAVLALVGRTGRKVGGRAHWF
jgi:hypothetical protein